MYIAAVCTSSSELKWHTLEPALEPELQAGLGSKFVSNSRVDGNGVGIFQTSEMLN